MQYLNHCETNTPEYGDTLKTLQDLCYFSGKIPSSFELQGIAFNRNNMIGRGGEAIVYRVQLNGKNVVVREVTLPLWEWGSPVGRKVTQVRITS